MSTYDAVDLFAGAGGWDVAANWLGLHVLGIEWNHAACETRRAAGFPTVEGDVRDYGPGTYPAEGLIASPPCQTFSTAGKGAGRLALDKVLALAHYVAATGLSPARGSFDDERTSLVLEPLRWTVRAMRTGRPYRWVAFEQVPTVLPVWEAYADHLRRYGYDVATGILNAEQYGVPQTRKRAILVASLDGPVTLPAPTHSRFYSRTPGKLDAGVLPWVSMAEALGWGMTRRPSMTVTGGGASTGGAEPFGNAARSGMRREAEAGRWVAMHTSGASCTTCPPRGIDGPSRTVLGKGQAAWLVSAQSVAGEGRATRDIDSPSVTVTQTISRAGFATNETKTRVTVEQAAILQTFPPDHPWQGTKSAQYLQVGNAVPPLLAEAILATLLTRTHLLRRKETDAA